MHEEGRAEHRICQMALGTDARLVEFAAARGRPGRATIIMDGETLGSGPDFRSAFRSALRRAGRTSTGIIRQASSVPVTERSVPSVTENTISGDDVVDCRDCGACCVHLGHPPFLRDMGPSLPAEPAWNTLPPELQTEIEIYMAHLEFDGYGDDGEPCFWLDMETRRCKHYLHRPGVCREFERGDEDCVHMRVECGVENPDSGLDSPRGVRSGFQATENTIGRVRASDGR